MKKELEELQPDISNIIYRGLAKFVPDHKINLVDDVATDLVEYISEILVKNNSVLDDVIKCFEVGTRVSWCKHSSPCFYVMEQKGKDVLICNTTNVEDDNYNDWWVDYKEINVL